MSHRSRCAVERAQRADVRQREKRANGILGETLVDLEDFDTFFGEPLHRAEIMSATSASTGA